MPGIVKVCVEIHRILGVPLGNKPLGYQTGSRLSVTLLVRNCLGPKQIKADWADDPQNYYPTLYALNDPLPIAVCKGDVLPDGSPIPDGERTYSNACTIKVCSPYRKGLLAD